MIMSCGVCNLSTSLTALVNERNPFFHSEYRCLVSLNDAEEKNKGLAGPCSPFWNTP